MPPREATNPFPDQYLTLDYETSGPIVLPHDNVGGDDAGGGAAGGDDGADDQSFGGGGAAGGGGDQQQADGTADLDPASIDQVPSGVQGDGSVSVDPLGMTDGPPGVLLSGENFGLAIGSSGSAHLENQHPLPVPAVSPSQSAGSHASSSRRGRGGGQGGVDPLSIDPTPGGAPDHWGGDPPAAGGRRSRPRRHRHGRGGPQDPPPVTGLERAHSAVQSYGPSVGNPHDENQTPVPASASFPFVGGGAALLTPPGHHSPPPNVSRTASSASSSSSTGESTAPLSTGSPFPSSEPTSPLTPADFVVGAASRGGGGHAPVPPAPSSLSGPSPPSSSVPASVGAGSGAESPVDSRHTNRLLRAYQQGLPPSALGEEEDGANEHGSDSSRPSRRFRRHQHHHHHHPQQASPHQLFSSVLDNSTTLESDDEDDEDEGEDQSQPPMLDTTNVSDTTEDADDEGGPGITSETDVSITAAAASPRHMPGGPYGNGMVTDEDVSEASSHSSFLTPASTMAGNAYAAAASPSAASVASQMSQGSQGSSGSSESMLQLHSSAAFDYSASEQGTPQGQRGAYPGGMFHPQGAPFPPPAPALGPYPPPAGGPAHPPSAAAAHGRPSRGHGQRRHRHHPQAPQQQQHHHHQQQQQQAQQAPHHHHHHQPPRHPYPHAPGHYQPPPAAPLRNSSSSSSSSSPSPSQSRSTSPLTLSFGPQTTVSDLTYFAERGCIVALLAALDTPRLKTLGARMLADYAKTADRRVAVASNRRILEFVGRTMLESPPPAEEEEGGGFGCDADGPEDGIMGGMGPEWLAREYAVETVRSLTATEQSDGYLMSCPGLLRTLALVARGGPFVTVRRTSASGIDDPILAAQGGGEMMGRSRVGTLGLASSKARLHACIAVMNLSCGKSNKVEIAGVPEVLEAMRDVMLGAHFPPPGSERPSSSSGSGTNAAEEARLKAVTCVKNLSNADANDAALLGTPGLVEALGHVARTTCTPQRGATTCTTNACLALMNLSISKSNKHRVFRTPGVMDALMAVITRTSPSAQDGGDGASSSSNAANAEARVKACSALSNLAIGYDNKIPMFAYPGFVDAILQVIETDGGEARTKACSILWSFAAEMKNQVPVVRRGDILPTLVRVAEEDHSTEARFKCVAALTLLAESLENAVPLLEAGALTPLMDILHEAGPDPTQWKGQTASWCVGFLMNIAQSDEAVPSLRQAGVVELLAPLLTLDHYQSLKAAMAVTFVCRYDEGDETYDLLRKTENVIPKIISLLHNTLSGRGGNGYKYGVFTLRSSVGCISSLASGPDFMKERVATAPVFESLLRVLSDFCVGGGTPGAIVGGGRDDALSATLAMRALQSLTAHLIPVAGSSALPFGTDVDDRLVAACESFEISPHPEIRDETRRLASDAKMRVLGSRSLLAASSSFGGGGVSPAAAKHVIALDDAAEEDAVGPAASLAASIANSCCGVGLPGLPSMGELEGCFPSHLLAGRPPPPPIAAPTKGVLEARPAAGGQGMEVVEPDEASISAASAASLSDGGGGGPGGGDAVRTFLLADTRTGRRFAVPTDPTGGRAFNDDRPWCYRRGRFCRPGESPDPHFRWTEELQRAYDAAVGGAARGFGAGAAPAHHQSAASLSGGGGAGGAAAGTEDAVMSAQTL